MSLINFPLLTSIKPPSSAEELSLLRECVASWHAAGFAPVSINGPSEAAALKDLDLGVTFSIQPADGKPRISAFFYAARESGARFAGIINSDCRIILPALAKRLCDGLGPRSMALAWRVDIDEVGNLATRQRGGFDAFFFATGSLPADDCDFHIAGPFWDIWFPLAYEMAGGQVEILSMPVIAHTAHPVRWREESNVPGDLRGWAEITRWQRRGDMPESLITRLPDERDGRLGAIILRWLEEYRPSTMSLIAPEAADIEILLRLGGAALLREQYWNDVGALKKKRPKILPKFMRDLPWLRQPRKQMIALRQKLNFKSS